MKIHILFEFQQGAWGGGNQFLKALRDYFIERNVYEGDIDNADIILFNSHQELETLIKIKLQFPEKLFVHRIDGPIFKIRDKDLVIDKMIYKINDDFADGTIFQSVWSQAENFKLGLDNNADSTIIINAPDPTLFYPVKNKKLGKKIKIIITSWSANMNKGFEIYKWLDENLNFSKYEMSFVGNSPIKFKNIKLIGAMDSGKLGSLLRTKDIFITASRKDPCSNSLIEAMHSGLPSIAYNDGGHPEIVGSGGEIFDSKDQIPQLLEDIVRNYSKYSKNISLLNLNEVGDKYYKFLSKIHKKHKLDPKQISNMKYYKSILYIKYFLFISKMTKVLKLKNTLRNRK
ncbi:MAG: glycosyltransferase [Candidatus Woesearchaeota archaeon]|jgi:glycosyltransferase involved in cell wall biosynthesis|nr:glycosyltransferase [Candidatus Woesearchaeota archaeon]